MAAGGFDAVVGNPPYVRAELIKPDKPHLERHYAATYHGSADLYVYFYELALTLLNPAGRLGFIVTNKWLKADYGGALRTHFGRHARIDRLIDFGHAKAIFPDADVFPCILIAGRPSDVLTPPPMSGCATWSAGRWRSPTWTLNTRSRAAATTCRPAGCRRRDGWSGRRPNSTCSSGWSGPVGRSRR